MKRILMFVMLLMVCLPVRSQELSGPDIPFHTTVEFVKNTDEFVLNDKYTNFICNIIPFVDAHADEIESVILIGSASPEGNKERNTVLADKRAEAISNYLTDFIPRSKIVTENDYALFLSKTGLQETDFSKLRATYIEIQMKSAKCQEPPRIDTVFIERPDTVFLEHLVVQEPQTKPKPKPTLSVSNDLFNDLIMRGNVGIEKYFRKSSLFIDGSFSNGTMYGKAYNTALWHCGLRCYFNRDFNRFFVELYGRTGYFDTNLFMDEGKYGVLFGGGIGAGYKFDIGKKWKIYPLVRIGYDRVYFKNYDSGGQGNINLQFGSYTDGRTSNGSGDGNTDIIGQGAVLTIKGNREIDSKFFENCYTAHMFYPTYVGLVLQRDFFYKKHKK